MKTQKLDQYLYLLRYTDSDLAATLVRFEFSLTLVCFLCRFVSYAESKNICILWDLLEFWRKELQCTRNCQMRARLPHRQQPSIQIPPHL
jgi:hypothetical protein